MLSPSTHPGDGAGAALLRLLNRLDRDPRTRGTQFEQLVAHVLRTDPVLSTLYRKVWRWADWPGRWGADAGIDLVAETADGGMIAVQCKAYDQQYSVTKSDIDSFLSESSRPLFTRRLLVATTDRIGATAIRTLEGQDKPVDRLMWTALAALDLTWPDSPDDLRLTPTPPRTARPHQQLAVDAVADALADGGRAQLRMACGTGKTLVGLWSAQALESQTTLVLLPSLSLLAQTLRAWLGSAVPSPRWLAVCSDDTVTGDTAKSDTLTRTVRELGFPTTVDPAHIAAFLTGSRAGAGPSVVFATYQSSARVAAAQELVDVGFGLVIADEAHRCAGEGSGPYTVILGDSTIRSRARLFMTATPRIATSRARRSAAEVDDVGQLASMDDTSIFGPVVHTLTFHEAISKGLLVDYRVCVVGISDTDVAAAIGERRLLTPTPGPHMAAGGPSSAIIDAAAAAMQLAVLKAVGAFSLTRVITFHSRVSGARRFATDLPGFAATLDPDSADNPVVSADWVSGAMNSAARDTRIAAFSLPDDPPTATSARLLANARCLGEGIDIPAVDGVAFIDPRRSVVDVVQAVGRAIRLHPDKKVGTIVLPVFVDAAEGGDPLSDAALDTVWEVVRALRAHDDTLAAEFDAGRRALGRRPADSPELPDRFVFDLPGELGAAFARAVRVRVLEVGADRWNLGLGYLEGYVDAHGDARVARAYLTGTGFRLGSWCASRRAEYQRGVLSEDRVDQLEQLGFPWDLYAADFDRYLDALRVWAGEHNNADVPQSHVTHDGLALGSWLSRRRGERRTGTLPAEQERALTAIGVRWEPLRDTFTEGLRRLATFHDEHGHTRVRIGWRTPDGYPLGTWLGSRRMEYSVGRLSPGEVTDLDALGVDWNPFATSWSRNFAAAAAWVRAHGHSRIPHAFITADGLPVGYWLSRQRTRSDELSTARLAEMEAAGILLDGPEARAREHETQRIVDGLTAFKTEHGHVRVLRDYVTPEGHRLGDAIENARGRRRRGRLSPQLETALTTLGLDWNPHQDTWDNAVAAYTAYTVRTGSVRPPRNYMTDDDFPLGDWIGKQRAARNTGTLDQARVDQLSEAGIEWDPFSDDFSVGLDRLTAYKAANGHARPPASYCDLDGYKLGRWLVQRRTDWKAQKLAPDRVAALEQLGVEWEVLEAKFAEGLAHLQDFVRQRGHAVTTSKTVSADGFRLGMWVDGRRQAHRKGRLSTPHTAALLNTGVSLGEQGDRGR